MLIKSVDHERYMTHVMDVMVKSCSPGSRKATRGGD